MPTKLEGYEKTRASSGTSGSMDFEQRVCENIFNKEIKRKRIKVIPDIALTLLEWEALSLLEWEALTLLEWEALTLLEWEALTLLEVESACQYRLRCITERSTKLAWLHIIGIAPSTPREDILELMPLDMFMNADKL